MRLTTLVNDPSEHRHTRFKLTKGNYATEAVLTSRSSATSLRYPEINGRGMNSVPHQRCMGTGNSIWTSRTHQVRRPLLHQVVRIKALPVGKHPTKFLRAEAQPPSPLHTLITPSIHTTFRYTTFSTKKVFIKRETTHPAMTFGTRSQSRFSIWCGRRSRRSR